MIAPTTSTATPQAPVKPRIGVSSCLLGEPVRFNGGHSRCRFLTGELSSLVHWVPFCPEIAIGLGSPRETLRLTVGARLVNRAGTADHTAAVAALPLPADLDGYVFKAKSPTCGIRGIARYRDDGHPADHGGVGAFAERLMATFPLLPVEDEGRLNDPALREAFIERIFASARLRELLSSPWRPYDLVRFHARHKLQLLAHDPAHGQMAGQVTAHAGGNPLAQTAAAYRQLFCTAMARRPTRGRHTNALLHAFSHLSKQLDQGRRADLLNRIEAYRRGHAPLSIPIALLSHHARSDTLPWLADQTYLAPFPDVLRLRHSVLRQDGSRPTAANPGQHGRRQLVAPWLGGHRSTLFQVSQG